MQKNNKKIEKNTSQEQESNIRYCLIYQDTIDGGYNAYCLNVDLSPDYGYNNTYESITDLLKDFKTIPNDCNVYECIFNQNGSINIKLAHEKKIKMAFLDVY